MSNPSFTRSAYDECALKKKSQESAALFERLTDANVMESKEVCYHSTSPFMQNPFRSVPQNAVDVESELRGQNIFNSRCPDEKYNPSKPFKSNFNITLNDCGKSDLIPEYTRINKSCNYSGININRFQPLCENVQDPNKIHSNNFIGMNTRLQIKDAFKAKKVFK